MKQSSGFFNFLFVFVAGFLSALFISPNIGTERINALESRFEVIDDQIANLEHQRIKSDIEQGEQTEAILILLKENGMRSERLEKMNRADKLGLVNQ